MLMTRTVAFARYLLLRREYRKVSAQLEKLPLLEKRRLAALVLKEVAAARQHDFPHLYFSKEDTRYHLWGSGTRLAFERMRSENPQLQIRGLALWITVAFYETQNSPYKELNNMHRTLVKTMRFLKHLVPDLRSSKPVALKAA